MATHHPTPGRDEPRRADRIARAIVGALLALAPIEARADTSGSPLGVSVTVAAVCSIGANPLDFGVYTAAQIDVTSTITVTCSNAAPYTIFLDAGTGPGATTDTRVMVNGAQTLNYTLYSSTGSRGTGPTVWGSSSRSGPSGVSGNGNGGAQSYTAYGRLFAGQSGVPGTYTDTITATIVY